MKYMIIAMITSLAIAFTTYSQSGEVFDVTRGSLQMGRLQTGNSTYLVYLKKTVDGPAEGLTLVKIRIDPTTLENRKAYRIRQRWYKENALFHTSETIHDAADFSTLKHDYWWKLPDKRELLGNFDFIRKQASVDGGFDDKTKARILADFEKSFDNYNLSWHSDLSVFTLFPYKTGRVFRVNFYDPGASPVMIAEYRVTGVESLTRSDGKSVECWVMEYTSAQPNGEKSIQRFWVSKSTREVLKEEDSFPNGLRYKFKLAISGEN